MKITLRSARVNAKLTQEDVAKELGVSKRTLGLWENGEVSPRIANIMKMLEMYGVEIENIDFEIK